MSRVRLTIGRLMIFVAMVALLLVSVMWLGQEADLLPDFVFAFVEIDGHVFPHTSPIFWIILTLTLAIALALFAGIIALIIRALKAIERS